MKTVKNLKEIIERAITVVLYRDGDISTEDGNFATTSTDAIILLEGAITEFFSDEANSDDVTVDNYSDIMNAVASLNLSIDYVNSKQVKS